MGPATGSTRRLWGSRNLRCISRFNVSRSFSTSCSGCKILSTFFFVGALPVTSAGRACISHRCWWCFPSVYHLLNSGGDQVPSSISADKGAGPLSLRLPLRRQEGGGFCSSILA
ncbi:hypothetical protein TRIUR3_27924 [Triticum urartu]|uniref:Uncharacterized protein n=1 Tax=Triticum urartu TaxID=4572 RepID=M7ZBM9_TRIUA|nr:hypothetical protein TRIUR3_27924 [Triticum urartu]